MRKILMLTLLLCACHPIEEEPAASAVGGLKKVVLESEADLQRLRDSGAELIVIEKDYVIVRVENTAMAETFNLQTFEENELVQRLVKIPLSDSLGLQPIVDNGLDLWSHEDEVAIARAFDIQIERLRKLGYSVEVIAQDASRREEQK